MVAAEEEYWPVEQVTSRFRTVRRHPLHGTTGAVGPDIQNPI